MPEETTIILIDVSYFIFYRYYALISWWKLAKPDNVIGNPIENVEFVEKFKKTFKDKLLEIPKKLKIKNFIILGALDCPRLNIWRHSLFDKYKENRVYDDEFLGGPFFELGIQLLKELNISTLKHPVLEADDCIAIFTKLKNNTDKILIIANDMDYLQLISPQVKIINLKYHDLTDSKKWSGNPKKDLFYKIIMGDKSDNIPAVLNKCGPKTAEKCYNDRKYFEERLKKENAYERYEKNKKLIDFNEIPPELIIEFNTMNAI